MPDLSLNSLGAERSEGPIDHIISGLRSRAGGGLAEVKTLNDVLIPSGVRSQNDSDATR